MWVCLHTLFPQVFRKGSSTKDTGKTGGGVLWYDLDQDSFALGFPTLAHPHPAGAEHRHELQPGHSASNACHSRVMVERGRPTGLVFPP